MQYLLIPVFLFFASNSLAATVDISATTSSDELIVGEQFELTIFGNYPGPATLAGGALNVMFDSSVVSALSVAVAPGVSDIASSEGTIDNASGKIGTVGFSTFFGVSGAFEIAKIMFEAVGAGATQIELSDPGDLVFTWTNFDFSVGPFGDSVTPEFTNVGVSVVPLPNVVVLFALLCAGVVSRRKIRPV